MPSADTHFSSRFSSQFPHLLDGLNPEQQEAVCHKDGPLLVLAGPGSGKTRVVTHRIAALIAQGVRGSQIAALTFTNKAAEEMKSRIANLIPEDSRFVWVGTFHRFCARLLRLYADLVGISSNYSIYDTDEAKRLLETVVDKKRFAPGVSIAGLQSTISWAKNGLILPEDYQPNEGSLIGMTAKDVYPVYQDSLKRANAVDFDDLLVYIAHILQKHSDVRLRLSDRFRYLLVDEYQDTNLAQYAIARSLAAEHRNLSVTGDPDQSIYGWRGANLRNILDFEKDFENVKVVKLEQNYRSTPQILAVAAQLIDFNKQRKKKTLFTHNPDGPPVRLLQCSDQREEADTIAAEIAREIRSGKRRPSDFAIFYRMNALSRNLEHALRRENVPFQLIRGLEFFNRKEIKDLIAYLSVLYNPSDAVALMRIINEPTRGIGKTTQQKIARHAEHLGIAIFEGARSITSVLGVSPKIRKAVTDFVAMIDRLRQAAAQDYPIESLLAEVLRETGYTKQFNPDETEEDEDRLENIEELISEAREFDRRPLEEGESPLGRFLEQVALVSDVDALDDGSERVALMTFHAAKGLEFPVVYIIALEENILPHERSSADTSQLEEERRLFFVGITRSCKELRLSRCRYREYRGSFGSAIMSRFLLELPTAQMELCDDPERLRHGDEPYVVYENGTDRREPDIFADDANFPDGLDDGIDPEYDEDGRLIPPKRRKKPAPKFSLMTGADLLKQRQGGEIEGDDGSGKVDEDDSLPF